MWKHSQADHHDGRVRRPDRHLDRVETLRHHRHGPPSTPAAFAYDPTRARVVFSRRQCGFRLLSERRAEEKSKKNQNFFSEKVRLALSLARSFSVALSFFSNQAFGSLIFGWLLQYVLSVLDPDSFVRKRTARVEISFFCLRMGETRPLEDPRRAQRIRACPVRLSRSTVSHVRIGARAAECHFDSRVLESRWDSKLRFETRVQDPDLAMCSLNEARVHSKTRLDAFLG